MDITSRTIYVENFPLETTRSLLDRLFGNFGTIENIELPTFGPEHPLCRGLAKPKTKGYAFIEFGSLDAAKHACSFFNKLDFILRDDLSEDHKTKKTKLDTDELVNKISDNLEYRRLLNVRVMTKEKHQEMVKRFGDMKFQSLVKTAELLIVT